jgi:S1-C subfamily serine protease
MVAVALLASAAGAGLGLTLSGGRSPRVQATVQRNVSTQTKAHAATNRLTVAQIAHKVDPAVVDITSQLGYQQATAAGTGMILTSDGLVLTNNHVVDGATSITARVAGSSRVFQVRVLGTDPSADVAVVRLVGASGLSTVTVGDSSGVLVGERVVAIGNALDLPGLPTVTSGTVSAIGRSITASDSASGSAENLSGLIQTDAPINHGDSGGPLLDMSGRVIGMDTAAAASMSTESASNVGFAIPIARAVAIARQIEAGHASSTIYLGRPGFLGVDVQDAASALGQTGIAPATDRGALVDGVIPGTPAAAAGLNPGDVIVAVDGRRIGSATGLTAALAGRHPGDQVSVSWVDPQGGRQTATVTLTTGPVR